MPTRFLVVPRSSSCHYHCVSRVVDRRFVFGTLERDVFLKILRQVEAFSGVRVVTWTILSNHFHVLLEIPPGPAEPLTDDEILERCRALYSKDAMVAIEWEFEEAKRIGGVQLESLKNRFTKRMWDLSEFMKTLKQKFSKWFNRNHDRVGTLWESRFRSVLVEGSWKSLLKVAAYIDLNAVRAGIVADPKDYRWSGYAEAVGGGRRARRGLAAALCEGKPDATWRDVAPRYRLVMFGIAEEKATHHALDRAAIARAFRKGGSLTLPQLLRCRVRYLTAGLAIGSAPFLEKIFRAKRSTFSDRRGSIQRRMIGGAWEGLLCARDLRVDPILPPDLDPPPG